MRYKLDLAAEMRRALVDAPDEQPAVDPAKIAIAAHHRLESLQRDALAFWSHTQKERRLYAQIAEDMTRQTEQQLRLVARLAPVFSHRISD